MQAMPIVEEPRRSGCLTVYLVLGMILYLLSILGLGLIQATPGAAGAIDMPGWAITANLIEAVIYLLLLIGVWLWLRWAVVGLILLTAVDLGLTVVSGRPLTDAVLSLGFLLLLLVLIRPAWRQME